MDYDGLAGTWLALVVAYNRATSLTPNYSVINSAFTVVCYHSPVFLVFQKGGPSALKNGKPVTR